MLSSDKRIEYLARAIVNRLEDRGLVEFEDAEAGIEIVARIIGEHVQVSEAIEQEARRRLVTAGQKDPSDDDVLDEMKRVAAEKNVVL